MANQITKGDIENWLEGYLKAWKSNSAQDIAALITEDAVYSTGPFDAPWIGQQAIIDGWIGIGDRPGDWAFDYEVIAVDGDLGGVKGTTVYRDPASTFGRI